MKSPVLRVMSYAQTWETEMVSTVLLREQDQAGHESNHFRGKHGFSQGLCRLPTRYVLYVRSSISSRFVGEKRESSDSCCLLICLLGFLSNSKILCVCQSVSLNFRQAAGAAKCPARLRVKAEKAVWRHLDRWRPWNFDRYVLMLEANLPQEALYILYSLGGFMDDLAIVLQVLHLLRGCSEIDRRTLTSDAALAALAWIMIPRPIGTTAALNPSVLCIPRLFIPAGSNPLETDLDTGYPIHFRILFVWESTGRIQAFTRSIVERVQKKIELWVLICHHSFCL